MIKPSWKGIEENYRKSGHEVWFCLPASNPNARLFKVYWRIFTRHSPHEGYEFLAQAPLLCHHDARLAVEESRDANEPVWLYPLRRPRWDPGIMPWDLTHPRWRDVAHWAPAYDDDPDPVGRDGFR